MKAPMFRVGARLPTALTLAVMAVAVTACGGGGSSDTPTLGQLYAQTTNQDTSASQTFTVNDNDGASGVALTATSSDPSLLPGDGITFGGSGGVRSIRVTPAEDATGTATVSVTATDAKGNASTASYSVTVSAVTRSIAAYTQSTFAQSETDSPAQVSGFTFVQDADDPATFAPLLQ